MAMAVQYFEVRQWVFRYDDHIGFFARDQTAKIFIQAKCHGTVQRRGLNDFQRVKAGFAQQFQFLNEREAINFVDVTGIRTGGDTAAMIFVVIEELHPEPVVFAPGNFLFGGPVKPERAMRIAVGFKKLSEHRHGVFRVPGRVALRFGIAGRFIDGQRRVDGEIETDQFIAHRVPFV